MMKKFLASVLIVGAAFGAGYYVGQQPPEEVRKQLRELSQEVMEQTIGLEEGELLLQKNFCKPRPGFWTVRTKS